MEITYDYETDSWKSFKTENQDSIYPSSIYLLLCTKIYSCIKIRSLFIAKHLTNILHRLSTFYQVRFRSNQTSKIIELLNKTELRTKRDCGGERNSVKNADLLSSIESKLASMGQWLEFVFVSGQLASIIRSALSCWPALA